MEAYTVYRLKFKTQLHLGRATGAAQTGSLGLREKLRPISPQIPSFLQSAKHGQPFTMPKVLPIFSINTPWTAQRRHLC